jgi:glycosyltransferase involved in cell wall biosynthesis
MRLPIESASTVMHLTPEIGRRSFGLGPIAVNLGLHQALRGWAPQIWCIDHEDEIDWATAIHGISPKLIRAFKRLGPRLLSYSPGMEKAAAGPEGHRIAVLHQQGIWNTLSHVTVLWRKAHKKPTVIAAQGSLDNYAIRRSRWKKSLALAGYERENLRSATCLHALSEAELRNYREFGLRNPVAIIPNGISASWLDARPDPTAFRRKIALPAESRILLYVSRITPKKGLPMLIEALHRVRDLLDQWCLVIAGVDEFEHESEVRSLVARLGLNPWVIFAGPIFGKEKRDAFAAADLFVLPSHSEGAPLVILEALGAGVPVLTTKASPWSQLVTHGCGWWTETSVDAIETALRDALSKPSQELIVMGRLGRMLVQSEYTWTKVTDQTIELYEWLLGRRPKPAFVVLD